MVSAMKLEMELKSPSAGTVLEVRTQAGATVANKAVLARLRCRAVAAGASGPKKAQVLRRLDGGQGYVQFYSSVESLVRV